MITVPSDAAVAARSPRICVVINERAHANRRAPRRLRELEQLAGPHVRVMATRSLEELAAACAALAHERPDVLAICGGDGTLHQTLTGLIRSYAGRALPPIAILRGGAMNIAAASLGVRGDPVEQLRMLVSLRERGELARYLSGRSARVDGARPRLELFERSMLRVGDRYGFLFGTGVIYSFLEAYYTAREPSGMTAACLLVRAAASTLVGGPLVRRLCRPLHARVVSDGRIWEPEQFVAICGATIEQIGFGFRPFRQCRDRIDGFEVLGIHATPLELLRELPRVRAGKPMRPQKAIDEVTRAIAIESLDAGEIGYTLDGDLYTSDRVLRVESGPTLRFLRTAR